MKILFGIFGFEDSCKYIIDALEDHEVLYFLPRGNIIKSDKNKIVYDCSQENFHDILKKMPSDFVPDVVVLWGPEYTSMPLLIEECPYPLVSIIGDWNLSFSNIKDIINCFDYSFVCDKKGVKLFQKYGYQPIEYISMWGFDPNTQYKIENTDKIYDVLFIGNLHSDIHKYRSSWLKRLAKLSNKYNIKILAGIHGYNYTLALNQSKITFNRSIKGELNMRVYEAAACNSLLFHEEEDIEIRNIFKDREHCVLYNETDFEELIEYYLTHDDEREKICNNSYAEVQQYSYKNQMNKIIKKTEEILPYLDIAKRKFTYLPEITKHNLRAVQVVNTVNNQKYAYAFSELEKALNINPKDSLTVNNMACVLAEAKQFDKAINILKNLLFIPVLSDFEHVFKFEGLSHNYFHHQYNYTTGNDRAIEVPIIMNFVEEYKGKNILEVGNVLSHYYNFEHDIVDKYEKGEGVINEDIIDFKPNKKYDLIVAISTLEHVGWDEDIKDPDKIFVAVEHLKTLLREGGKLIFTIPVGYNSNLDNLLKEKKLTFDKEYYFQRLDYTKWLQVEEEKFSYDVKFGEPFPWSSNALLIGLIEDKLPLVKINKLPYFNLANICLMADKKTEAMEYFAKLISDLENNTDNITLEGLLFFFEYDYLKIEWEKAHFNNFTEHDITQAKTNLILYESYRRLGESYSELNEYNNALTSLQKSINYRDDGYLAYKNLSEIYTELKDYEKAERYLEQAIHYNSLYPDYWKDLIDLYVFSNKDCIPFVDECLMILSAIPKLKRYIPVFEKYKSKTITNLYQPYKSFTMPHYNLGGAISDFNIKITDKVLDIGGGDAPFERADVVTELYLEDNTHRLGRSIRKDKKYVECNVEELPFNDKEFDFVYCNHVLEHTDSPEKACKELMRVAKRGYIEVPSYWGEYLFGHTFHKWFLYWIDNTLIFQRKPYVQKDKFDTPFDGIVHYWWEIKKQMDFVRYWQIDYRNFWTIQLLWEDSFKFKVIEDDAQDNKSLESLLSDYIDIEYNGNIIKFPCKNAFGNNYPSFDIESLMKTFCINDCSKLLAIGDDEYLDQFKTFENITLFNIKDKLFQPLPFNNKEFDFIFTGDILVRISDPRFLCDEIKRVGKQGFIEIPNGWTEFIFKETSNKWFVENKNNRLCFYSRNFVNSPFSENLYKEYIQNEKLQQQYDITYRNITRIQFHWQFTFEYEIEDKPENIKTDFSLFWQGAFFLPIGYGDEARNFVTAVNSNFKVDIKIRNTIGLLNNFNLNKDDYLSPTISKLTDTELKEPVVSIYHWIPKKFPDEKSTLNILRTMFETASLPYDMVKICNQFDEIWVPSDFNMRSFATSGVDYSKLFKIPGNLDTDLFDPAKVAPLDIDELKNKFVFLSNFEFQLRKGWDILLKAFDEEFKDQDDVILMLKIYNYLPEVSMDDVKKQIYSLIKKQKIFFFDDFLPLKEYPRLYKTANCYVMPSRGEGWGRPYMEAMSMELPVIGTRWSGNMEFMNDANSFLIDCGWSNVPNNVEYTVFQGQRWAEPSIAHLKTHLRYVYDNYEQAKLKGVIARQDILRKYSDKKISQLIMKRINHLLDKKKETQIIKNPRANEFLRLIKDYCNKGKTLETGVSSEYYSVLLASQGIAAYCFDGSPTRLKYLKHLDAISYKGNIMDETCYRDYPYDVIFHQDILNGDDKQIRQIINIQIKYCRYLIFNISSKQQRSLSLEQWESILSPYEILELRYYGKKNEYIIAVIKGKIPLKEDASIAIIWEGSVMGNNSLAIVNKNIASELENYDINLRIIPYEIDVLNEENLDSNIKKIIHNPLFRSPDIYIRHHWPPNFDTPASDKFVVMQPWEFGNIPEEWVKKINEGIMEVWVYSNYNKECYVKSGVPENKIHVIPLGIDPAIYNPQVQPMELNTMKTFKFLFVGGTIDRKGIDVLLDAYCEIFTNDDDVSLVIKDFGVNSFYKKQNMAKNIKTIIKDNTKPEILYLNKEDYTAHEMAGIYTSCDCFVFPYRGEGFGLPVAEAMACGLPVIVTDKGSCMDFCNEDNSYLIKSEIVTINKIMDAKESYWANPDKESLKNLMKYAYNHRQEAKNKGEAASRFIRTNFTWEKTAKKVYERILFLKGTTQNTAKYENSISDLLEKGLENLELENWDEAEKCYLNILNIDTQHPDALYNLGIVHLKKHDEEKAIIFFNKSIETGKISLYAVSLVLENMGFKEIVNKIHKKSG